MKVDTALWAHDWGKDFTLTFHFTAPALVTVLALSVRDTMAVTDVMFCQLHCRVSYVGRCQTTLGLMLRRSRRVLTRTCSTCSMLR